MNFRRANVLRDSTGLARGDFRFADGVQQAGFPVVDVAHDGHDRRARFQIFRFFFPRDFLHHVFFKRQHLDDAVEGFCQAGGGRGVQGLVDACEDAAVQQYFQNFLGAHVQLFGQIADRHAFRDGNFSRLPRRRSRRALDLRRAALAGTHACPHRMQLALAFFKALFHRGPRAGRGLARIDWLAGFGFRWCLVGG